MQTACGWRSRPGGTQIYLGIDTGGTYTDAVLYDRRRGILATAKAPTTRHKLSIGIEAAVRGVLSVPPADIELVSLSSTLATNAIVEGQGSPVCLLLIGYGPQLLEGIELGRLIADGRTVFISGGHTVTGDELQPLDIEAAHAAVLANAPFVSAFAVSGYFGVRNPDHELRVKGLVRRLTNLPVTCGHELTSQLDAPRRAVTTAINARLISLIYSQVTGLKQFLATLGINAPLMVVKGDGSLIDAEMALERPVETILSGPAASVVGALHLSRKKTAIVADIGGTTTDVALVRDGLPSLSSQGATVGGWRTMVEAIDVHTTGLGGDSEVRTDRDGALVVGPRRVIPLCMLAHDHACVLDLLKADLQRIPSPEDGRVVMRQRPMPAGHILTRSQRAVWLRLEDGPVSLNALMAGAESPVSVTFAAAELADEGLVAICAFTPTDAEHVLGRYDAWSAEAARIGAELWARRLNTPVDDFCRAVIDRVVVQAGHIVLETALAGDGIASASEQDAVGRIALDRALGAAPAGNVAFAASLQVPVVGVGAPAAAYIKPLARRLHTRVAIPQNAAVGNAVGAVVGGIVQTVRVSVRQPLGVDGPFRVFLPTGIKDFPHEDRAVAHAKAAARRLALARARKAGAEHARVVVRQDGLAVEKASGAVFMGMEITATAAGRPRLKAPAQ